MGQQYDDERDGSGPLSRRDFLKRSSAVGAGAAMAPLVLNLTACSGGGEDTSPGPDGTGSSKATGDGSEAGATGDGSGDGSGSEASGGAAGGAADTGGSTGTGGGATNSDAIADGAVLLGLYSGDGEAAAQEAAKKLDFSWLGEGDTVLIKVATNSGNPHPATTSPAGVKGMVAELKARGAGKVIVADQSGVEHVRLSAQGRFSSTRERWQSNGLIAVEDVADVHFFDDGGFEEGYFSATLPDENNWPNGMYLPNIIKEVDHIVYMPRIGAHTLAGLTLGQKSAIGWLRDDSRHDLHNAAAQIYEKYAEINYTQEIRDRFRMIVTINEAVLLFGGPDEGTEFHMEPTLVVASNSLANHDALACSILVTLQNISGAAPAGMLYNAASASLFNTFFAGGAGVSTGEAGPWVSGSTGSGYTPHRFEDGVSQERAITRGWQLNGGKPDSISVVLDGESIDEGLKGGMETHGEGLYSFG
ncbi:MAG: DUF362 domain-containing protein [Myxococcales bacterium]|nr:DUF362 domain-containing protein [Myxococcales bacterium]